MGKGSEGDSADETHFRSPLFLTKKDGIGKADLERRMKVHGGSERETDDLCFYC